MIEKSRALQIFQGVISLILGAVSVLLAVMLWKSTRLVAVPFTFVVIGVTLIFSGDYLINLFGMPVNPFKQRFLSEVCLIAYGAFYVNIGVSKLLQPLSLLGISQILHPVWIRRGVAGIGIFLVIGGIYGIAELLKTPQTEPVE